MSNTIQYLGATTVSHGNTLNETEQVVANLTQKVKDITSLVQQMAGTELSMSKSLNLLQNATQNNYNPDPTDPRPAERVHQYHRSELPGG
jgi:hypothetical protein